MDLQSLPKRHHCLPGLCIYAVLKRYAFVLVNATLLMMVLFRRFVPYAGWVAEKIKLGLGELGLTDNTALTYWHFVGAILWKNLK